MLNGVVQSVNDANERSRQTLQPYQSLWLAHWKRTDCDAVGETCSPNSSGSEELDYITRKDGLTKGLEAPSRSASGLGRIKNRTFEIGDDFIKAGRKSVGNERMISSLFKDGQVTDNLQVLAQNLELSKAVHNRSGIPLSEFHSVVEDISDNPPKLMRTCSAGKGSLFRLNSLKERFVESSSRSLPYKFEKGKAAVSVADMRKVGSPSQSDNSSDECLRESISCGHCLSTINGGWFWEMQKSSGIRLFPSQSNSSEENETKKSHNDCYSQLKLQKCVHGFGTMRICTSVDVPGRTLAGSPRSSRTNNDLVITKKTDVNALEDNDTFRSKRVFTKINGNMSGVHSILPFFGQNKQKVHLQPLRCLNDTEVKENIRDAKAFKVTIRNELSAETDTMDIDYFKEKKSKNNLHSASNSTASAKIFNTESDEVVPSREVWHERVNNKLPDVNSKLPALPGAASSRTLSVMQPNFSLDESPNADGGNRWVKRLKFSSSNSNDAEDEKEESSKIEEGHPIETADEKGKALLLSHAWIQRWLHSRGIKTKKTSEIEDIPKLTLEKLDKGPFPSIAAMALMAKTVTCFQQCEVQKKGSYTVWNTKNL